MAKEPVLVTLWKINRIAPLICAFLLLLTVGALILLNSYLLPRLEQQENLLLERQGYARGDVQGSDPAARQRLARQLDEFYQMLPTEDAWPFLVVELPALAASHGLSISRIDYRPTEFGPRPLLRYGLSFAVTGSYDQVKRFIHEVETAARLFVLESLTLKSESAVDDRVSVQMQLATFFRMDKP